VVPAAVAPPLPGARGAVQGGVTSQDFIEFWGNFFVFILSALVGNP
jgi:hypothetical protein